MADAAGGSGAASEGAGGNSRSRRGTHQSRRTYWLCHLSVLEEENGAQIQAFLAKHPEFSVQPPTEVIQCLGERAFMFGKAARLSREGVLMTPRTTDTDGFFASVLRRGG